MKNILWLGVIQVSNALVPLIAIPYVWSICGAEVASILAVTESVSAVVLVITVYSFDLTGVSDLLREQARTKTHGQEFYQNKLFWGIFSARAILFLCSGLTVASITYTIKGSMYFWPLAGWLFYPAGYILFGYWRQQAIAENRVVSIATLIGRVTGLAIILFTISSDSSASFIALVLSGTYAAAAALFFLYIINAEIGLPRQASLRMARKLLADGYEVFLSSVSVILYRGLNVIILELTGIHAVGIASYAVAEKAIKVLQASVRPLNQHYLPSITSALADHILADRKAFQVIRLTATKQSQVIITLVCVGYSIGGIFWALKLDEVFGLDTTLLVLLMILLPSIIAGVGTYQYGSIGLNQLAARRQLLGLTFGIGLLNILMCYMLSNTLGEYGAAIAYTLSEWLLFISLIIIYHLPSKTM